MRWIHGIGSNCILESATFGPHFKNYNAKCIETGNGWIDVFETEIKKACDKLQAEEETLKEGFTLIGISQGGLIARAVVQRCDIGQHVKRLITIGGPHMGIVSIPQLDPNSFINKILPLCAYDWAQNWVGPCGYIRDVRASGYKNMKNSVKELNNELEFQEQYKERLQGLDVFMAIGFDDDHMIQPKNTAVWGYYRDDQYKDYADMEFFDVYKENRLGLRELDESGKLFRCVVEGDHLQLGTENMQSLVLNFSDWTKKEYESDMEKISELCVFHMD